MKCKTEIIENSCELVHKLLPVTVHKFVAPFWEEDGVADGILVRVECWHGDVMYVRPEIMLKPINGKWKEQT